MTNKKKTILAVSIAALLSPVILFVLLTIIIYIPAVQNVIVNKVAEAASEETGMDISIDEVCLKFPLDLKIEGIKVLKPNAEGKRDTIADIKAVVADVKLIPLFSGRVDIDEFSINDARVNTSDIIETAVIKGDIGSLLIESRGIDLNNDSVMINSAVLNNASVTITLIDKETEEDTTETKNDWKIAAGQLAVNNSDLKLVMAGDTLVAGAKLGSLIVNRPHIDLGTGIYKACSITADKSSLTFDNTYADSIAGMDYNHIALHDFALAADSLMYSAERTRAILSKLTFKERSGLVLSQMNGRAEMDTAYIDVPELNIKTPNSELALTADMDFTAFDDKNSSGNCNALVSGYIGKQDIMLFLGAMPEQFRRSWPSKPMRITASCSGNINDMKINRAAIDLPTAFKVNAEGRLTNITKNIGGSLDVGLNTYDLSFITSLIEHPVRIPHLKGDAQVMLKGSQYAADISLMQTDSTAINAHASYNADSEEYNAELSLAGVNLIDFLPADSIYQTDASFMLKGCRTDVFNKYTDIEFEGIVDRIVYGKKNIRNINLDGRLENGRAIVDLISDNEMVRGRITFDALIDEKILNTTFACDIIEADMMQLGLYEEPIKAGICAHVDLATDAKEYFRINGFLNDITIRDGDKVHRPSSIVMNINTSADTTYADVQCGDLDLFIDADGGIKRLVTVGDTLMGRLKHQLEARIINQHEIIKTLPNGSIRMHSGQDNFFAKVLEYYGYTFKDVSMKMDMSPKTGLNGNIDVLALKTSDVLLDSINVAVMSDSTQCRYKARIKNSMRNPRYVFTALSDGYIFDKGLGCNLKYIDRTGEVGLDVGLKASMLDRGIKFELPKLDPVIGYTSFRVNKNNHIYLDKTGRLSSNVKFVAADGTGFMLFSDDENRNASQDLTLTMHKMDLGKIFSVMPYMPKVTGLLDGDLHMVQTEDATTMSADMEVKQLTYENSPMGNVGTELVYMPLSDGSHYVDGRIMQNSREIASLTGKYIPTGSENLDIEIMMERFPMDITNGFFPYHLLGLHGYAEGGLEIKGSTSKPVVNGELFLDSSYIESVPFGVEMQFANDPVRIVGSNLLFENFELYSHNKNPLVLYGKLDFSDLEKINMDIRMQAHEFLLVDSKEKKYSVAYGKAMVDFMGRMRGMLDNLKVTGSLDVLSSTDLVYILRDSPLSEDNRMDDLVKFVNFEDTAHVEKKRPELSGLDMDMHVIVQDGAHVVANLNADKTNYVDLMGGGRLRMQYNVLDDFRLTGKYTLSSGEMKYSLPVIPLKTFAITEGSYVEFTGDAMNPRLNITATERTSAAVGNEDGATRTVDFDCGVEVTRTLNDMGLKFIISAPEDMEVQNQLASMSEEQRGKLAVTMLTTGMYLSDGNTSAFSMNNALSSFLQSEINQIASSAMQTMDVSVGVDNSTNAAGEQHTDYSFKFAKRFWNNRMKIIVGGSVSTGAEMENSNNSFFDNVSFEYRLDKSASKNLRLFYEREAYDLLEGEVSEYGVGFVWRKRMHKLTDLFRKEKKKKYQTKSFDNKNKLKDSDNKNAEEPVKTTLKEGTEQ